MNNLIIGLTLLMSMSTFAETQNPISKMNIYCGSELDAVCEDLNEKGSYAISHECTEKILKKEGSFLPIIGHYITKVTNRVLIKLGEAVDPNCHNDQQQCGQDPRQGEDVYPTGNHSEKFIMYGKNFTNKQPDGSYSTSYYTKLINVERSDLYHDRKFDIISKIECSK